MAILVFTDWEAFAAWLNERANALAMEVEPCNLSDCGPAWQISWKQLFRPDGSFFQVIGAWAKKVAGREVPFWKQPMIAGEQNAKAAIVVTGDDEIRLTATPLPPQLVLVRAKADIGNIGVKLADGTNSRVLMAPSVQFSQGNLDQHNKFRAGESGVQSVPLAGIIFDAELKDARWEDAPQDGARFYEKVDAVAVLKMSSREVADRYVGELKEAAQADFVWVTRDVLAEVRRRGLVNAHLRLALSAE